MLNAFPVYRHPNLERLRNHWQQLLLWKDLMQKPWQKLKHEHESRNNGPDQIAVENRNYTSLTTSVRNAFIEYFNSRRVHGKTI